MDDKPLEANRWMPGGMLKLEGTLDLEQFWPVGMSDADTTKLVIRVEGDGFLFRKAPAAPYRRTRVFEGAFVLGRTRGPAIDDQGRVVVRLQGIDAPELHYRASCLVDKAVRTEVQTAAFHTWDHAYRQPLAETATVELASMLADAAHGRLRCTVLTAVSSPEEVFDTYGRMVGDVHVRVGGRDVCVNHWLVERGWALPGLYTSMSVAEIAQVIRLSSTARRGRRGIWRYLSRIAAAFPWLRYRGVGAVLDRRGDRGPVLLPKLFRRLCIWAVNHRAKTGEGSFERYLAGRDDTCVLTKGFLEGEPSKPRHFREFLRERELGVGPADVVFNEATSRLEVPGGGQPRW